MKKKKIEFIFFFLKQQRRVFLSFICLLFDYFITS